MAKPLVAIAGLLGAAGLFAVVGCSHHLSRTHAADTVTISRGPASTSPYAVLADPGLYRKPDEVPLVGGSGKGSNQFSLDKLPATATHLILRWDCSGSGTWEEYLDDVLYSSSPCAANTLSTADLPLRQAHLHPKTMTIKAPAGMYWKISVTQLGGELG